MKQSTRTKRRSSANTKSKKAPKRATKSKQPKKSTKRNAPVRILVVAGEESGDILGGSIIAAVRKKNRGLTIWGCGGRRMAKSGVDIRYSSEELATIGFFEAARNYRRLKKIVNALVREAVANGTQMAWLVDFPGFNLILAKALKAHGIHSTMIVSPTVWAWKYKRVFKIRDRFDRVLCLYDFEPKIYKEIGVEAHYIGHPLTVETAGFRKSLSQKKNPLLALPEVALQLAQKKKVIAIMPGSRPAEVHYHTERILDGVRMFQANNPGYIFVLPAANDRIYKLLETYSLPPDTYLTHLSAPYVLNVATAAIACSGTVTLECALFGVPHLILYRSSWLSYGIFKGVIRIPYIGMVNVLAGKFIVQEFLQHKFKGPAIAAELERVANDGAYRRTQLTELKKIATRLTAFEPSKRAAEILLANLH
jgi:lipid-A-disaccharide synthase